MIKLYSTGCPSCILLEKELNDKRMDYEKISDIEEIQRVANENKVSRVPFIINNGNEFLGMTESFKFVRMTRGANDE